MSASSKIKAWRDDPVLFVRDVFGAEPDAWQEKALRNITPKGVIRICLRACVGPGKSCLLAWIGWWFLACFKRGEDYPIGAAVAITRDNLRSNLWTELIRWHGRSELLQRSFTCQAEVIFENEHPKTWKLEARGFAKSANADEMGRTLSGLHSKFVFVLLDETGDMHPAVGRAAEQAMSTIQGDHVGLIAQAGNPSSTQGLLYESSVRHASNWQVTVITSDPDDPMRTPRVSVEYAREQIEKYGRDNPWVQYAFLGQFPEQAFNSLLSIAQVEEAMARKRPQAQYSHFPVMLGVDVARSGDDSSVLFPRQGCCAFEPTEMRNRDSIQVATTVGEHINRMDIDHVCVDDSGGYGGGVIDNLKSMGHRPHPISFSGKPVDPRYYNKRSEMWFMMAEWVKTVGRLPDCPQLLVELTEPEYYYKGDRMILEPKEAIKQRIGKSPDFADALGLTFAVPVNARSAVLQGQRQRNALM